MKSWKERIHDDVMRGLDGAVNFWWPIVLWTVLIVGLAAWNFRQAYLAELKTVTAVARDSIHKDLGYRLWASMHGGVYVPVTSNTPPHSYLSHIPERDISTPSGKALTLINPAYMIRQVHELIRDRFGLRAHITSLKPIRAENAPDPWELQMLKSFATNPVERISLERLDGNQYLRVIIPLVTEKSCLTCHAQQGYREGDIRGGLASSVPWSPYSGGLWQQLNDYLIFGLIWGVGVAGLWWANLRKQRYLAHVRKSADALRESRKQYRALVERTPDLITRVDTEGRICFANEAVRNYFGMSPEECIGRVVFDFVVPEDRVKTQEAFNTWLTSGQDHYEYENRVAAIDGRIHILTWVICADRDGAGKTVGFSNTGRDVTERKRMEEELLKMQKLQSVGTLAGGIAHDFNNIMMGVFGNISLAKDELSDHHPARKSLDDAGKSMERAVRLTKQLLTFSKGGNPVREAMNLGPVVEDVARFDLTGSNVMLVYKQDDKLWPVLADRGQIQQVISNLTINARQAMPNGGHLHMTLENVEWGGASIPNLKPGNYVRTTIRDEGQGIDPKIIGRIFDPFYSTKATGHGLGLATVYAIMQKHGGHIAVESELGKGACFTLFLPAVV